MNKSDTIDCRDEYEVYVGDETEVIKKGKQIVQKGFSYSTEKLIKDENWFDNVQDLIDENHNYQIVRDVFSYFSYIIFFCFGILIKKIKPRLKFWNKKNKKDSSIIFDPKPASRSNFETNEAITIEMVSEISDEKDCICKICNFKAKTQGGLKVHQSRVHKVISN